VSRWIWRGVGEGVRVGSRLAAHTWFGAGEMKGEERIVKGIWRAWWWKTLVAKVGWSRQAGSEFDTLEISSLCRYSVQSQNLLELR
jgi:hypothetical protein